MKRHLFCLGVVFCIFILSSAYIIEYRLHLEPCTLCILERLVIWTTAIVLGIASIHNPARVGMLVYSMVLGFLNILGLLIAFRHLWLQYGSSVDQLKPCAADLKTLLQFKPWAQAISEILFHTEDCAVIDKLLGIPLSVWSLLSFFMLGVISILIFKQSLKS